MLGQIFDSHAEEHIQRDVKKLVAVHTAQLRSLSTHLLFRFRAPSLLVNPQSAIRIPQFFFPPQDFLALLFVP